jgi:hypothetical protein
MGLLAVLAQHVMMQTSSETKETPFRGSHVKGKFRISERSVSD